MYTYTTLIFFSHNTDSPAIFRSYRCKYREVTCVIIFFVTKSERHKRPITAAAAVK